MLMELSVMEQRYQAVLEVLVAGLTVTEVAELHGVSRKAVHAWIARYRAGGLPALADRSHRPKHHPAQLSAETETLICEMRRAHPRWGPRRLVYELAKKEATPAPSRSSVYRTLVRNHLVAAKPRTKRREDYLHWERERPMQLWQHDFLEDVMFADGSKGYILTGIDDHSRFCVEAQVVTRVTGRAACAGLVAALRAYGCPEEVLTDNGRQFTGRLQRPRPVEVLFERICRENGIQTLHGAVHKPTTQGKVERLHHTIREELLDVKGPFIDLAAAQAATDAWRHAYNFHRPHQSLDMATPASKFRTVPASEREALPLRVPTVLAVAAASPLPADDVPASVVEPVPARTLSSDAVEIDRVIPASGNLRVLPQQFWLGPDRAGQVVTLWIDTQSVYLLMGGQRLKTLRSRFTSSDLARLRADGARPAGPPPAHASASELASARAIEIDRMVDASGLIALGKVRVSVGFALAGQRITLRIEGDLMQVIADGVLVRTLPTPVPSGALLRLRGARVAGPPPQLREGPISVQRRVSARGGIMVAKQGIQIGGTHAHRIVTVVVEDTSFTVVSEEGEVLKVVARTTHEELLVFKAKGRSRAS